MPTNSTSWCRSTRRTTRTPTDRLPHHEGGAPSTGGTAFMHLRAWNWARQHVDDMRGRGVTNPGTSPCTPSEHRSHDDRDDGRSDDDRDERYAAASAKPPAYASAVYAVCAVSGEMVPAPDERQPQYSYGESPHEYGRQTEHAHGESEGGHRQRVQTVHASRLHN